MSENQERALQQELANSKARVGDLEQSLQYAEQRVHGMADNLARFSDQKYVIEVSVIVFIIVKLRYRAWLMVRFFKSEM